MTFLSFLSEDEQKLIKGILVLGGAKLAYDEIKHIRKKEREEEEDYY